MSHQGLHQSFIMSSHSSARLVDNTKHQQVLMLWATVLRKYALALLPKCQLSNVKRSSEHNAFARHVNSSAARPDTELMPLVNANNAAIPGFPATPSQLRSLTGKRTIPHICVSPTE